MSIKDLTLVLKELDAIPDGAQSIFWDSMRQAGEIVAEEMAAKAPGGDTGRLKHSFGVWQSKKLSRQYRAVVFRVGLINRSTSPAFYPNFYATLAKGRKSYERKGTGYRGSNARHPGWKLPGDDPVARDHLIRLTKMIFSGKISTIDQMIKRGRKR